MSVSLSVENLTVAAGFVACMALFSHTASADDISSGELMTKLAPEERGAYIAGLVEGIAYARYQAHGKDDADMACVKNWFYQNDETPAKVFSALENFPDYAPGAVLFAMIQKECGA